MAMTARRTAPITAVERAVTAIREGIRDGRYALGQRLVEAELTKVLGVSRGPLREAMWRLAGEGLVTIEPNRGVMVRRLTEQDLIEIYEIRELLEGLAARRAATRIDEDQHRALLDKANKQCRHAQRTNDVTAYMEANEAFHDTIVEISGNDRLFDLITQLRLPLFRLQFQRMLTPGSARQSVDEHADIYKAITDADPARAERAMRKHVKASGKLLRQLARKTPP